MWTMDGTHRTRADDFPPPPVSADALEVNQRGSPGNDDHGTGGAPHYLARDIGLAAPGGPGRTSVKPTSKRSTSSPERSINVWAESATLFLRVHHQRLAGALAT
jgi:hypothetical protein